jgi:hypothetical protein
MGGQRVGTSACWARQPPKQISPATPVRYCMLIPVRDRRPELREQFGHDSASVPSAFCGNFSPFLRVGPILELWHGTHARATHRNSRNGFYVVAALLKAPLLKGHSSLGRGPPRASWGFRVQLRSSFGRDPGLFFGASDSPRSLPCVGVAFERGEAHGEGGGRLGLCDMLPSTAETILVLRSTE